MSEERVQCPFCEGEVSATAKKCRHCGEWLTTQEAFCASCGTKIRGQWAARGICAECEGSRSSTSVQEPVQARIRKKTETFGEGCMIQGFGCLGGLLLIGLVPVLGWIVGPVFIIAMLVHGSNKATKWICGNCGNPVADKHVRSCPACRAQLN